MTAYKYTMAFGRRVYGLGLMALGAVNLMWGDFDTGQPVPDDFPHRTHLPISPLRSCSWRASQSNGVGPQPRRPLRWLCITRSWLWS